MAAKKQIVRSNSAFTLVGDDDSVAQFVAALNQTISQSGQLSASVGQLKNDVDQVVTVLSYPKTVSDDLNNLDSVLSTVSTLLTAVSIIPEIGEAAMAINEAVGSLQTEVTPAKDAAAAIEAECAPFQDALGQVDSVLGDALQGINTITSDTQTFLTNFQAIDACINNLPDGPVKSQGLSYLSTFAATTTPYVNQVNSVLGTVNGAVGAFDSAIDQIENQLSFLSEISGTIDSLLNELSPLLGPLKSLQSLLNTSITIPTPVPFYGVHVSIEDILTDFKAFTDLAMQILAPVLNPILQPLEDLAQSIISQIPGIGQLMNLNLNLPTIPNFTDLFSNLTVLANQLEAAIQQFTLQCPPQAGLVTFAAQLDRHMKAVGSVFAHGAAHSIGLGGKKHLTAAGGKVGVSSDPVAKSSLFIARLDPTRRVVLSTPSGKHLALDKGSLVLKKGAVTQASHFKVVARKGGKFSLRGPGNSLVSVEGTSEFTANRH